MSDAILAMPDQNYQITQKPISSSPILNTSADNSEHVRVLGTWADSTEYGMTKADKVTAGLVLR